MSKAEIQSRILARTNAINAADVEGIVADVDEDVVTYELVPPLRSKGIAASRRRAVEWLGTYKDGPRWEDGEIEVAVDGDVAFSHSLNRVTGTAKSGEEGHVVPDHARLAPTRRPLANRPRPQFSALRSRERNGEARPPSGTCAMTARSTSTRPGAVRLRFGLLAIAAFALAGCEGQAGNQSERASPTTQAQEEARLEPTRTGYANVADGARIYYQVHGDLDAGKPPLLVLHGSFMSAEAMAPLAGRFADDRPVIVIAQRGHGRTGDTEGGLSFDVMADDAAGVLEALGVGSADVLGYSMGGSVAIAMAVRHPEWVGKQVIVAGTYRRDGWYPEVLDTMAAITPETFANTPMEAEYRRLSPTPDAFPTQVEEIRAMEARPYGWPEDAVRAIEGKTMVIVGDADGVELEHAVELFKLRGGGDRKAAATGSITGAPDARLAILPATSHIGIMARAGLIAEMVTPFLDDITPPMPKGFFEEQ